MGKYQIPVVRVYEQVNEQTARPTEWMLGSNGIYYKKPLKNKTEIPISMVPPNCVVKDFHKNKSNENMTHYPQQHVQDQYSRGLNRSYPGSIQSDEYVTGGEARSRNEQPSTTGSGYTTLKFCLENKTDEAVTHVIGDSHNLNNRVHGYDVLPAGVIVTNNNWGTAILPLIQKVSGDNPFRLHELHMSNTRNGLPSTNFYTGGSLYYVRTDLAKKMSIRDEMDFTVTMNGADCAPYLQKMRDFRILLDGYGGVEYTIPAGEQVCFTMKLVSSAESYSMVQTR